GLQRELLPLDRVARVALELDESRAPRGDVAGRDRETPAARDATGRVQRFHGDPRRGRRLGGGLRRTVLVLLFLRRQRRQQDQARSEDERDRHAQHSPHESWLLVVGNGESVGTNTPITVVTLAGSGQGPEPPRSACGLTEASALWDHGFPS